LAKAKAEKPSTTMRVEVEAGFDTAELRRLLAVLKSMVVMGDHALWQEE
jgi:hypothetical protein